MDDPSLETLPPKPRAVPLNKRQRRILGVLVEKAICTPDQYPLTVNSLVSGCNQKSNRDPVTSYAADVIDETLLELMKQQWVIRVLPATGRVERWKHNLKEIWGLERAERAVLAELFLRGPQTEGELRGRAARMVEIPTLEELRRLLTALADRGFARRLTPDDRKRGVIWCHLFYPPDELAEVERMAAQDDRHAERAAESDVPTDAASPGGETSALPAPRHNVSELQVQMARLIAELDELREAHGKLAAEFHDFKSQLA